MIFSFVSIISVSDTLPAVVSVPVVRGTASGVCPSTNVIDAQRNALLQEIQDLLDNIVVPALSNRN